MNIIVLHVKHQCATTRKCFANDTLEGIHTKHGAFYHSVDGMKARLKSIYIRQALSPLIQNQCVINDYGDMDIFDDCSVSDGMESDDVFTEDSEDSYDGMELGECYDDKDIQF